MAAIAPYIGLFGTIWGIFHALCSIGNGGQAKVAAQVGGALIMTELALTVAIPAVTFYNIIIRMNRKILYMANDKAHDLLSGSMHPKCPAN